MGKHDEIWQSINDLDDRLTRLEESTHISDLEREVERLRGENARLIAERDALRARIEAGRVMYGGMYGHQNKFEMWTFQHVDTDTMTARLIDIAPLSDAGNMMDERVGMADRRENALWFPPESHKEKPCHRVYAPILIDTKTVEAARSNDRRRTPGTRADRKL
jgi:hypothetical protein